jgi:hypothetical protein
MITNLNKPSPPEPYLVEHNSYVGSWSRRQLWDSGDSIESAKMQDVGSDVPAIVPLISRSTYRTSRPGTLSRFALQLGQPSMASLVATSCFMLVISQVSDQKL